MSSERWLPCPPNPAYEVSDHGRVRRIGSDLILKAATTDRGYRKVSLGRRCQPYVHTLVAEAFIGPRPAGHEVDHLDWDRTNNRLDNLRWLHRRINCVRWAGRDGTRNLWATPDTVPEDFEPMTEAETAELGKELVAAGW